MGAVKKQKPYSRAGIVGNAVKSAMLRKNITSQAELSRLMGMNTSVVSCRFSGNPFWSLPELWKLDKILQFTDEEILKIAKCARK